MEFLKAILGEELYAQVENAINAFNGNEANKDKQVKLANLGTGEYVGKGKYDSLQTQLTGKQTELDTANGLIAELKKNTKGDEALQTKITEYESQLEQLQKENARIKLDNAIQLALRDAKGVDPDYLAYKLKEKYKEELTLDEAGKIKGWDDKLAGLKTQFPTQFETSSDGDDGFEVYKPNHLKKGDGGDGAPSKEQFRNMSFEERMNLKKNNEALYKQYVKN